MTPTIGFQALGDGENGPKNVQQLVDGILENHPELLDIDDIRDKVLAALMAASVFVAHPQTFSKAAFNATCGVGDDQNRLSGAEAKALMDVCITTGVLQKEQKGRLSISQATKAKLESLFEDLYP